MLLLLQKIAFYKPRVLALNSFTIWSDIASSLGKSNALPGVKLKVPSGQPRPALKLSWCETNRKPEFLPWKIVYANCDEASESGVKETLILVLPSTSGANAKYSVSCFSYSLASHWILIYSLLKRWLFSVMYMTHFQSSKRVHLTPVIWEKWILIWQILKYDSGSVHWTSTLPRNNHSIVNIVLRLQ